MPEGGDSVVKRLALLGRLSAFPPSALPEERVVFRGETRLPSRSRCPLGEREGDEDDCRRGKEQLGEIVCV